MVAEINIKILGENRKFIKWRKKACLLSPNFFPMRHSQNVPDPSLAFRDISSAKKKLKSLNLRNHCFFSRGRADGWDSLGPGSSSAILKIILNLRWWQKYSGFYCFNCFILYRRWLWVYRWQEPVWRWP